MELNPLYRLYVELNDKVELLRQSGTKSANGENVDLTDIILRLRNLESRPTYQEDISELKTNVSGLQQENMELKEKLAFVSSKMEQLEGRIYTLESEPRVNIEPLNSRLNTLENLQLSEQISRVETRMSNVEQLSNTITDVSYRLSEVERKPDVGERLYAIELALATMVVKPSSPTSV